MATITKRIRYYLASLTSGSQTENKLAARFTKSRRAQLEALESRELLAAYPYPQYYGPPTFEEFQAARGAENVVATELVAQSSADETPVITIDAFDTNATTEFDSNVPAELSEISIEEIDEIDVLFESYEVDDQFSGEYSDITEVLLDLTDDALTPIDTDIDLNINGDSVQSGGSGGSGGGASGGSGGSGHVYVSGGGAQAYYDVVLSADSTDIIQTPGYWGVSPDPSIPLVYSYTSTCSNIVSIQDFDSSSGAVYMIPTGTVGTGTITVTATNVYGSCTETISVYCGRVIGYQVVEKTYGSNIWNSVYDSGGFESNSSDAPWMMLWHENQYRWKPIFENNVAPQNYQINGVYFSSRDKETTDPYLGFAGNSYTPAPTSGGASIGNLPESDWPYAIGTPAYYGEKDIDVTVSISGFNLHQQGTFYIGYNSCTLDLNHSNSATQQQQRVALNRVYNVSWKAVDSNNAIRLGEDPNDNTQYRCFPEKYFPDSLLPHHQTNVSVRIFSQIPTGMHGTVFANYFDPLNRYGSDKEIVASYLNGVRKYSGSRDNNGSVTALNENECALELVFTNSDTNSGKTQKTFSFTFEVANAGDNYIIAVHPNNIIDTRYEIRDLEIIDINDDSTYDFELVYHNDDSSLPSVIVNSSLISPVLNVWRTLHIEKDVLTRTEPDNSVTAAVEPFTNGFVTSELSRACIVLEECADNDNYTIESCDIIINSTQSGLVVDPSTPLPTARDNSSSPYYWVIYGIGAFSSSSQSILGITTDHRFYIFNDTIKSMCNNDSYLIYIYQQGVALHEICHLFQLADDPYGIGAMSYQNVGDLDEFRLTNANIRAIQKVVMVQ